MKAKFFFIAIFATCDAFLGAFAVGFNSRHAIIGDPTIPAPKIEKKVPVPTAAAATSKATDSKVAASAKPEAKTGAKPAASKDAKSNHSKKDKTAKSKDKASQSKADKASASKADRIKAAKDSKSTNK